MTTSGNDSLRISTVICTYRHPDMLRAAVKSLLNQTLPAHEYEIIVIDNNSQDQTADVVKELAQTTSHSVRYIFEGRQGLSYARNTGVEAARGDIIAFLDDDAEADPGWLAALLDVYDRVPDAWEVGGKVLPIWGAERPSWFENTNEMLLSLSIVDWGEESRPIKRPELIIGANCSFRKQVFTEIGLFAVDLGRKGSLLLGSEETELQDRINNCGKLVFYTPQAVVYHHVPRERLTKRYLYSRAYGNGMSQAIMVFRSYGVTVFLKRFLLHVRALLLLCLSLAWRVWKEKNSFYTLRIMAYSWGYIKETIILILFRLVRKH